MHGVESKASNTNAGRPGASYARRVLWPTLLVFLGGLVVSWFMGWRLLAWSEQDDTRRTASEASQIKERFDSITERYEHGLARLQDYFVGCTNATDQQWQSRVSLLYPEVNFPAAREIGFAPFVGNGYLSLEGFKGWFELAHSNGPAPLLDTRDYTLPILFYHGGNPAVAPPYGLNLHTDKEQDWIAIRTAMVTAGLKTTRLSKPVSDFLPHSNSTVRWFWPVYKFQNNPSLEPTRKENPAFYYSLDFSGIVFATIDMDLIIASEFGTNAENLAFELFDGTDPSKANRLNPVSMAPSKDLLSGAPDLVMQVPWYLQKWCLRFYRTPQFNARSVRYRAWWAWGAGSLISVVLAGWVWNQARFRIRSQEHAVALQNTNDRLLAVLKDRERLSRDLHDNTLQNLYAIGLDLQYCCELAVQSNPEAADHLRRDTEHLDSVIFELRQVLLTLQPEVLRGGSLVPVLKSLAGRITAIKGCEVVIQADHSLAESIPPKTALQLVNFTREALSNSLRHGKATRIVILLTGDVDRWWFSVQDNGAGFDPAKLENSGGHGHRNMQARAQEINCEFSLESSPADGTRVKFAFPMTKI